MTEEGPELDGSPETGPPQRSQHALAALGYAVLTAWVMWPAVRDFRARAVVDDIDGSVFIWVWGRFTDAFGSGTDPFQTDLIFHPVGADLRLTTSAPLIAVLTWPVRAGLGPAAQVNTVQLASMFLAGLATHFLAHRLTRHSGAAFVAGVAYAVLPSRMFHSNGHLNLVETAVLPFGLIVFLRFTEAPSWRRAVALGVTVGAVFLIDPQLTILLVIGVTCLAVHRWRILLGQARQLAVAAVAALLVAAPLLVPMALALASGAGGDPHPTSSTLVYSSSPLSWVVPPLDRLWIGRFASLEPLTPSPEGVVYPGLVLLGLAVAGVTLSGPERRRGWVAMALVSVVLSFGPYLFVRNHLIEVPLPFFAVRAIPGLEALRVPGRFGLLGALAVGMLAALALAELARRRPQRGSLMVLLAVSLTLLELFPRPLPAHDAKASSVYEAIADDPGTGAVLEIPLKWSTGQEDFGFQGHDENFRFLLAQVVHRRPVVSGAVSRYPASDLDRLLAIQTYRQLLALGGEDGFEDGPTFGVRDLAELGIGFVVYHRDDPAPDVLRYFRSLDLPVLADDGTVIVWKVTG